MGRGRVRVDLVAVARRGRTRRRRRLLVATAAALLLVNGIAVRDLLVTNGHTRQLQHDELTAVDRKAARQRRATAETATLQATDAQLDTRTNERNRARTQVSSTAAEVSATRVDLGAVVARLALQVGQMTTLTTCMQGVSSAMNGLSVGDSTRGLGALHAVEGPCRDAATIGAGG